MTNPSGSGLAAFANHFDTMSLLEAVDAVDRLRERLTNNSNRTPEIRDKLLNLHKLSMDVITRGQQGKVGLISDLAEGLIDDIEEMESAVQAIREAIDHLLSVVPKQGSGTY